MPVVIIAGQDDRLIDIDHQSAELHRDVAQSTFHSVAGAGHMVHQTATKRVMAAINEAATSHQSKSGSRHWRHNPNGSSADRAAQRFTQKCGPALSAERSLRVWKSPCIVLAALSWKTTTLIAFELHRVREWLVNYSEFMSTTLRRKGSFRHLARLARSTSIGTS